MVDFANKPNIVFKGWFQGIRKDHFNGELPWGEKSRLIFDNPTKKDLAAIQNYISSNENKMYTYHNEKRLWSNLYRRGFETVFLENNCDNKEKGIDASLIVSAMNVVQNNLIEVVVIITNDGDFKPLIHNLRKKGIKVYTLSILLAKLDDNLEIQTEKTKGEVTVSYRLKNSSHHCFTLDKKMLKKWGNRIFYDRDENGYFEIEKDALETIYKSFFYI